MDDRETADALLRLGSEDMTASRPHKLPSSRSQRAAARRSPALDPADVEPDTPSAADCLKASFPAFRPSKRRRFGPNSRQAPRARGRAGNEDASSNSSSSGDSDGDFDDDDDASSDDLGSGGAGHSRRGNSSRRGGTNQGPRSVEERRRHR